MADARTIGTLMLWIEEARRMADRLAWYAEAFPALKTLCEEFGIEHNSAQWTPEESDALAWLITQQQTCLLEVVHPEVH